MSLWTEVRWRRVLLERGLINYTRRLYKIITEVNLLVVPELLCLPASLLGTRRR